MISKIFKKFSRKDSISEQESSKILLDKIMKAYSTMYNRRPKTVSLRKCVTPTVKETDELYGLKDSLAISYSGFTRRSIQFLLRLDGQKPITRMEIMQHEKTNELSDDFRVTTNLNETEVKGLKKIVKRTGTTFSAVIRYAIWQNL